MKRIVLTEEQRLVHAEASRQYRAKYPDRIRRYNLEYNRAHKVKRAQHIQDIKGRRLKEATERKKRIRHEVFMHYGNGKLQCVNCGFDDIRALSIDHIDNDGYEERKQRQGGVWFYLYLKKHHYPEGYQTLCMNCQFIKKDNQLKKVKVE